MFDTKTNKFKLVLLDMDSAKRLVINDPCFANARGGHRYVAFLILMSDKQNKANILHFASTRWKRATCSGMAAEVHALVLEFYLVFFITDIAVQTTGSTMNTERATDSKKMFNAVSKYGARTE